MSKPSNTITVSKLSLLLSLMLSIPLFAACDLVVPPKRPPESQILSQSNYAFDNINLLDYSFTGITRLDCPLISSALTGSGICAPHKTVVGKIVHCDLEYPYQTLEFGCLTDDEVPAAYVKLVAAKDAKNQTFPDSFGSCTPAQAGPAAGEEPRYATDPGYKVCLFEGSPTIAAGALSSNDSDARPIGLYLDFSETQSDDYQNMAQNNAYAGPYTLMLDARYLSPEDRERAFKTVFELFKVYRNSAPASTASQH